MMQTPSSKVITDLNDNDVLLGRGNPLTEYPGNIRFRAVVQKHQSEYRAAEMRLRKDGIARAVIRRIEESKGRFLERHHREEGGKTRQIGGKRVKRPADVEWVLADEEKVLLKVKQALRGKGFGPTKNRQFLSATEKRSQKVQTDEAGERQRNGS